MHLTPQLSLLTSQRFWEGETHLSELVGSTPLAKPPATSTPWADNLKE